MPKIFEYFGFVFLFYSNEHEPVHVHVLHCDRQTVFELILTDGQLTRIGKRFPEGWVPLDGKDEKTAEAFIRVYWQTIIRKWVDFFVLKKPVRCTKVKDRL